VYISGVGIGRLGVGKGIPAACSEILWDSLLSFIVSFVCCILATITINHDHHQPGIILTYRREVGWDWIYPAFSCYHYHIIECLVSSSQSCFTLYTFTSISIYPWLSHNFNHSNSMRAFLPALFMLPSVRRCGGGLGQSLAFKYSLVLAGE
jgi:hypothetical protein